MDAKPFAGSTAPVGTIRDDVLLMKLFYGVF